MNWPALIAGALIVAGIIAAVYYISVGDLTWSELKAILERFASEFEAGKTSHGVLQELNKVVKGKVSSVNVRTVRLDLLNSDDTRLAQVVISADDVSSSIEQNDVIWV